MQRRAATVYAVLFLVVAAGAYSFIGIAQQPEIDVDGQEYRENDTLTVNGFEYTFASVGSEEGTLTRVNESAIHTVTLENNTTVSLDDTTYRVLIPNTSDPEEFTLRQQFNLSENVSTLTQDGTKYVVLTEGENRTLVPVEQYKRQQFGEPETRQFAEDDAFQFEGNETTVANVTRSAVTLEYTAPRTFETSITDGANVTLGPEGNNQTFVAYFPEEGVVQLSPNPNEYQEDVEAIDQFNERIAGLWGVVILSFLTAILLVGLSFLPNK